LLLQELVQSYRPKNVPEVLAAKAGEFWSKMTQSPNESVDSYYNRFHEPLDDLDQADNKISTSSAMRHFIFTLGTEFTPIQNNYRIGNLPEAWKTTHWPSLLILCRDFYNSVNPKGLLSTSDKDATTDSFNQRMAQQKKVKEWLLNPLQYCKEIEKEQQKYPGKCIYHLSKTHSTDSCHIKIECEKLASTKRKPGNSSTPTSSTSGHLHHMQGDEDFEAAISAEPDTENMNVLDNDTNADSLPYFARMTNHYLRLVNSSSQSLSSPRHDTPFPVIADSGANFHMFRDKTLFETLSPASGTVLLGDGTTSLKIKGIGTVKCKVGDNVLVIEQFYARVCASLALSFAYSTIF
jgi:hypothetical protein